MTETALAGQRLHCASGRPGTGRIDADLLGGVVHISVGTCELHQPADDSAALDMIRMLLAGVAKAGAEVATEQAARDKRRARGT